MHVRSLATWGPRLFLAILVALWCVFLTTGGADPNDVGAAFAAIGLFVVMTVVVTALLITLHESAHALVGLLVRAELYGVTIGRGRRLFGFEIGRVLVEVRALPSGGVTILQPTGTQWRDVAVFSAGIAAEAGALGAAVLWQPSSVIGSSLKWATILVASIHIVLNLWPRSVTEQSAAVVHTDGAHIKKMMTDLEGWRRDLDAMELTPEVARLVQAIHGGDTTAAITLAEERVTASPTDVGPAEILAALLLAGHRWREAFDVLSPFADASDVAPVIQNNVAWAAVMTFDPALLSHADRWSEQAFLSAPTNAAFANTRGATLTLLDRPDDGLPLLKLASASKKLTRPDGAFVNAFRALAEHRSSDHGGAAKDHLALAEALDPKCPALPEVRRRMLDVAVAT